MVSGSLDTSIRVWDVETGNCIHTLTGHQSLTSGMELKDNILVSGNADSTVKIWDIKTGQCLQTLQGERGPQRGQELRTRPHCLKEIVGAFSFSLMYFIRNPFISAAGDQSEQGLQEMGKP